MEKVVSVIIPVYNHEKFIAKTMQSVLSQVYQNWEMIIVDDYSTDASWKIIQAIARRDKRVRVFKNNKNRGLIPNWRFLINKSKGEYIVFLEGDDYLRADYLQQKLKIFNKYNNIGMVYSDVSIVDENNKIILPRYYKSSKLKVFQNKMVKESEFLFSRVGLLMSYSQIMIRREVLEKSGYPRTFDEKAKVFLPSDWDFNFRVATRNKIFYIEKTLLFYRKHSNNSSSNIPLVGEHLKLILKHYEQRKQNSEEVLEGIEYQRGGILYYKALYLLEKKQKKRAIDVGKKYFWKYKRFFFRDFQLNSKLIIRLLLPTRCNEWIKRQYYKQGGIDC